MIAKADDCSPIMSNSVEMVMSKKLYKVGSESCRAQGAQVKRNFLLRILK